jgi:hypothetical protein
VFRSRQVSWSPRPPVLAFATSRMTSFAAAPFVLKRGDIDTPRCPLPIDAPVRGAGCVLRRERLRYRCQLYNAVCAGTRQQRVLTQCGSTSPAPPDRATLARETQVSAHRKTTRVGHQDASTWPQMLLVCHSHRRERCAILRDIARCCAILRDIIRYFASFHDIAKNLARLGLCVCVYCP